MLARRLRPHIQERLRHAAAVVLLGPRQVGKTTLARAIAAPRKSSAVYLDLERPMDLRRLQDADAFLRAQVGKLVVIDEIHRSPGLFEVLRGIIDERRRAGDRAGHFLLLGSASLDLLKQTSETLAGRVEYVELGGIDALELQRQIGDVDRLWVRGGFPESLLAKDDTESLNWRRAFARSYLERDVPMFAPRLPAETIGRLWTMLAHSQGTPLNQSRLASGLAVSTPAVGRYIDLLVDLLLVRRLRPWSGNVGKRLVRTPKTYIRDSGLVHALLDLETWDDVLGHPVVGASWEGFAIENLVAAAGERRTPYYYRTEDGAEVDLVFERGGRIEMAIEIKRSTSPALSRGFGAAHAVLKPKESYLVHSGTETWPVERNVTAIALRDLMRKLADSTGG
jgi:predicted AAA+ superfamily ATPase